MQTWLEGMQQKHPAPVNRSRHFLHSCPYHLQHFINLQKNKRLNIQTSETYNNGSTPECGLNHKYNKSQRLNLKLIKHIQHTNFLGENAQSHTYIHTTIKLLRILKKRKSIKQMKLILNLTSQSQHDIRKNKTSYSMDRTSYRM